MSSQTLAQLEAALTAHVNDEGDKPWLITGWVVTAAITSFEQTEPNQHSYWFEAAEAQPSHITRGLVNLADDWARSTNLFGDSDDDD